MSDATKAPERIWAAEPSRVSGCVISFTTPSAAYKTPYILATPAALAASPEVAALIQDGWRDDPESSEAWCAGNDYALTRLCKVLGVDPDKVAWDGSDGSRDEEADALIWRILHANDDDDGRSPAIREAEARGMERAAEIVDPLPDCECLDCAKRAEIAGGIRAEAAALKGETT